MFWLSHFRFIQLLHIKVLLSLSQAFSSVGAKREERRTTFRYVCPQALFRFLSPRFSTVFFFSRCAPITERLEEPG